MPFVADIFAAAAIFVVVTSLTAVLFVIWLMVTVLKTIARLVRRHIGLGERNVTPRLSSSNMCKAPRCRTVNPPFARFCRRCGQPIGEAVPSQMRPQMSMYQAGRNRRVAEHP